MRIRNAVSVLGSAFVLTVLGGSPVSAGVVRPDVLTLGPGSGCSAIGGSAIFCQVYPTGGTGNYWACWNGVCASYMHLYFSESCVPKSGYAVSVAVHDSQSVVSATYYVTCLGRPFLP